MSGGDGRADRRAMSGGEGREGPSDHDRQRLRATWRVLSVGWGVALLAAVVAGLAGLPGNVGAAALLLVGALATATAALHALVLALVDDLKDHRVWRRRPLIGVGLIVVAGLLLVMTGGALAT
jgi:hypothetical protein